MKYIIMILATVFTFSNANASALDKIASKVNAKTSEKKELNVNSVINDVAKKTIDEQTDKINKLIEDQVKVFSKSLESQIGGFSEQMVGKVDEVKGKIDEQVNDIKAKADKEFERVNKLISTAEKELADLQKMKNKIFKYIKLGMLAFSVLFLIPIFILLIFILKVIRMGKNITNLSFIVKNLDDLGLKLEDLDKKLANQNIK